MTTPPQDPYPYDPQGQGAYPPSQPYQQQYQQNQPSPYQYQQYQQQPYLTPATIEHPQGITVLIMGLLSLVVVQLLGPVAWIMGNRVLAEIDADPARYSNRGMVQAGRIMGMIATILMIVIVAFFVIVFAGVFATIGLSST